MTELLLLLCAVGVDRWFGEWPAAAHPVIWMGRTIRGVERRAPTSVGRALLWGAGMAVLLPLGWAAVCGGTLRVPMIGPVFALFWLKGAFALRVLGEAGQGVADPLVRGDLDGARQGLRSLCSRDASQLDAGQVAAGAVESLAENLSDSFVAPLFWWAVAGVPGAVAYRVINTLDAMIGYHGRYEWLGKASARLDDLANVVPARITAVLLLLVAWGGAGSARAGLRGLWEDRGRTESPNAGWPMAAMAGLLGVALEKPGYYVLGGGGAPAPGDVARAWRLCGRAAWVWVGVLAGWCLWRG